MDLSDYTHEQCSNNKPCKKIGEDLIELHPRMLFACHVANIGCQAWDPNAARTSKFHCANAPLTRHVAPTAGQSNGQSVTTAYANGGRLP
jgi:hypothetical protein